jgi:hypothetical protein
MLKFDPTRLWRRTEQLDFDRQEPREPSRAELLSQFAQWAALPAVRTSLTAVSPISKSADCRKLEGVGNRDGLRVWKPAIQQTWKSALRSLRHEFLPFSAFSLQPSALPAVPPKSPQFRSPKSAKTPAKPHIVKPRQPQKIFVEVGGPDGDRIYRISHHRGAETRRIHPPRFYGLTWP